jgi:hypothetical protein
MSSLRILGGKLMATWVLAGPAFFAGSAATLLGISILFGKEMESGPLDSVRALGALLRWFGLSFWYGIALTAVVGVCHWIGLRAETASRVWMWTIGWATAMIVLPPLGSAIFVRNEMVRAAIALLNPLLDEATWKVQDPPIVLFASIGVWIVFTAVVFIDNARRLPRRASRG